MKALCRDLDSVASGKQFEQSWTDHGLMNGLYFQGIYLLVAISRGVLPAASHIVCKLRRKHSFWDRGLLDSFHEQDTLKPSVSTTSAKKSDKDLDSGRRSCTVQRRVLVSMLG